MAIPRICPCGHRVPAGEPCACQKEKRAEKDKARLSARKRGYDTAWEKAAKAFLARPENKRCQCGAPAVVVMHRISIAKRPDLRMDPRNWRPGCVRCNAIEADRERRAAVSGQNTRQPGGRSKLSAQAKGPAVGPFSAIFFDATAKIRGC